ncbi:Glycerol uptake protein 1 [Balamuthia mandrillaris]
MEETEVTLQQSSLTPGVKDYAVALLPSLTMVCFVVHGLWRLWLRRKQKAAGGGPSISTREWLWISFLALWVCYWLSYLLWHGFWACQERAEQINAGVAGAAFKKLKPLPAKGEYAFWPERLWFSDTGRPVDYTDFQWRKWRSHLSIIVLGGTLMVLVSRFLQWAFQESTIQPAVNAKRSITAKMTTFGLSLRLLFYSIVGIGLIGYLHGMGGLFRLSVIVAVNYAIAKWGGASLWNPVLTWSWNVIVLVSCDYYDGYRLAPLLGPSFAWLDKDTGVIRWAIYFNMAMTRLISFNLDYYWMLRRKPCVTPKKSDLAIREVTHCPAESYNPLSYWAYFSYAPLYLAGPVLSFNAWYSQIVQPQITYSLKQISSLAIRTAIETLALSICTGYFYYWYINDTLQVWSQQLRPWELVATAVCVLVYMYVKFLVIWRTTRCWALFDGVDTVDNMATCVYNNCSIAGFWKHWHASLHAWIIRYMYIPLGGRKTQLYSMWLIFFFIGIWHDLMWRWMAWALFNCLFFSVEAATALLLDSPQWRWIKVTTLYDPFLRGFGYVFSILGLFVINLAIMHGFANSKLFLERLCLQPDSGPVVLLILITVFMWGHLNSKLDTTTTKESQQESKQNTSSAMHSWKRDDAITTKHL